MSRDNPFSGGFDKDDDLAAVIAGNGASAWGSGRGGGDGGGGGGGGAASGAEREESAGVGAVGGNAWGSSSSAAAAPPPVISVADDDRALSSARAALDARERQLAAREASLARAEEEVRRQRAAGAAGASSSGTAAAEGKEKNWPPCCSVLHHDIAGEVPADAQAAVTSAYRAYLGLVVCLVYNCAAAFARLAANKMDPTKLPAFLMSAIYLTAGVPGAWVLWYARLYHAAIKDRAITYLWFFLMFSAHLIFCVWSAIAPPIAGGAAHAGFVEGVTALSKSAFVGGVYLAGGCLWSLESLWSFWTLQRSYATFRGHGADRRLKAELQAAGADAAAVAAGAAIRGGAAGGGGGGRV